MLPYPIIDSHCHIYPDAIARKAVKAVDDFYECLPPDPYDGTVGTLLSLGEQYGIRHFLVHSVATSPRQVSSINRFISQSVAASDGHFTGFGTMHLDSDDLERDLNELVALGLKGVKLHPDIQRFAVDDKRAMAIFGMCEERGLPVCVHTGDSRYNYSNPEKAKIVLEAFPRLTFIGAHFGGWSMWHEAMRVLSRYPNIWVDTSSSLKWLTPRDIRDLVDAYTPERVMFGTDYPLWPVQPEIDRLLSAGLPDEITQKIFWKNAAGLLGVYDQLDPQKA